MIGPRHIQLLALGISDLLGQPAKGTVAFLRCLPSLSIEALAASNEFLVAGFSIFGVIDRQDESCRLITADRAVELREDKGDSILLLIDPHRAGAGLDGIYNAGREISEAELFNAAIGLVRKELPRGYARFSRTAVALARRIGQRSMVTPWQEFDFLVAALDSPGTAVACLGLWPILCESAPGTQVVQVSWELVDRLLVDRTIGLTPQAKVAALMLDDSDGKQAVELERFLRENTNANPGTVVARLLTYPSLWLGALKPQFSGGELREIELISWRDRAGRMLKWSGLRLELAELSPGSQLSQLKPRFVLEQQTAGGKEGPSLEVRWNTKATALPNCIVDYSVTIVSGD
jgi:hypothetical protein